jgi:alkaline phosphatase D
METGIESSMGGEIFLLMVGLDGFRSDYLDRYNAPNLRAFRDAGASAEALEPCFATTTFPNFYSMMTGLTPAHHGIIDMDFWDPRRKERFYFRDPKATTDGTWFGGTPLWAAAERAGLRSAILFWPGSSAAIGGIRPWQWFEYDPRVTREEKLRRVLGWYAMPEEERPRLVGLYFPDVDEAGHAYGPDSAQTRAAVEQVDRAFGELMAALRAVKPEVNVIVAADHGMFTVKEGIDLRADLNGCVVTNAVSLVHLHCGGGGEADRVYQAVPRDDSRYRVYRRTEIPARLEYSGNPRIGDVVVMPEPGYLVELLPPGSHSSLPKFAGTHGYEAARCPEMNGILLAGGPRIRKGARTGKARTVDVHALATALLDLPQPQGTDGKLAPVKGMLR